MNSMYLKLTKLFLRENFTLKRLMGFDTKKAKAKTILISIAILYAIATFLGLFGYMFFDLGKILFQMGQIEVLVSFLAVYSIGLTFILVLFRAHGYLFHYKDYEILAPLPISQRTVLYAKMTTMFILIFISSFAFTLPIGFSYFYWNGISAIGLISYILSLIVFPLVPIIIVSMMSLGVNYITSKFKFNKIFNIIFMFIIFLAFMLFSFSLGETEVNPLTGQIDFYKGLSDLYLPMKWMIYAIHDHDLLSLFFLVLGNISVFVLFMYLIQNLVNYTNQRGFKANFRKNHKAITYQSRPLMLTLVIKEWKKLISVPIYALNAGFGTVILLVAGVASLFYQNELQNMLSQMMGTGISIETMVLILIGFSVSMAYTPAISLSLEGKNFWIVKSLPISPKTIMLSKVLFNMVLIIPVAILSIILFGIAIKIPFISQIMMILLIISFGTAISLYDSIVNLYMPKFNFINEVEVVKNSAGALLGVFGGFFLITLSGLLYYLLNQTFIIEINLLFLILFNILLCGVFYTWMTKKVDLIFIKL